MLDMLEMSLEELVKHLSTGEIDLQSYLVEVQKHFDEVEPSILAFVPEKYRFERLKIEAEELLKRFPNPEKRPVLFGALVGIKDIFHVSGFETRAGSDLPPAELAGYEAGSVRRLRAAGVLILGKTVTTEFAYFAPGPTRNPHNLGHTPGGSSSGSAAAVAARLCPLTSGTQTIGSINRPAAFCGVVGFKPTYDRVPRDGVIPLSPSLDHVGLFAKNVQSMEKAASVICSDWKKASNSKQPVLGVVEGPYLENASAEGLEQFRQVCSQLIEGSYQIRHVEALTHMSELVQRHNLILAAEAAQVHAYWFSKYQGRYHRKTADLITTGRQKTVIELTRALTSRQELRQQLSQLMSEEGVDLWISPSAPGVAPAGLESTGDPVMNLPWTHSGLPTLTLPSGKNQEGLPFGLQLVGGWASDEQLLSWSKQIEEKLGSLI